VMIENVDRDSITYNASYFRLKDMQGYEYGHSNALPDDSLISGSLRRGRNATGRILFEVPEQAVQPGSKLVVIYHPIIMLDDYPEIRVLIQPGN
jgi:hypothetical protein